jgi:hypothetical protein
MALALEALEKLRIVIGTLDPENECTNYRKHKEKQPVREQ